MTKNTDSSNQDFARRIDKLNAARRRAQARIDDGILPGFPEASRDIRGADWRVTATADAHPRYLPLQDPLAPGALESIVAALAGAARKPCVELPNLRTREEARLWHDIFRAAEAHGTVPPNAIRAAIPVDTVQAAFELDEILHELRDYAVRLQWDRNAYLLSFIRAFHRYPEFVLPDRSELTIGAPFLRALGKHAMRVGEQRGIVADEFPAPSPDSRNPVESADLLQIHVGKITERGVRENLRIAFESLNDTGRHEPASAGLALAQLWQWTHHATGVLDEGRNVDGALIERLIAEAGEGHAAEKLLPLISGAACPVAAFPAK